MAEDNLSIFEDNIDDLRKKVESGPHQDFKRKLVGGIDENEVALYINTIGERLRKSEEMYQTRIKEITNSKKMLQDELEKYKGNINESVKVTTELNNAIRRLETDKAALREELEKTTSELSDCQGELSDCRSQLSDCISELTECKNQLAACKSEPTACKNELKDCRNELLNYKNKFEELQTELQLEKAETISCVEEIDRLKGCLSDMEKQDNSPLETKLSDIMQEMTILYKQVEGLEELLKANNELKQQLEMERARADKAERNLNDFGKLVTELENKINYRANK